MFAQNFALEVCVVSHTPQETLVRPRGCLEEDYSDLRKLLLSALMMSEISSTTPWPRRLTSIGNASREVVGT